MSSASESGGARAERFVLVRRIIEAWALLGGVLLVVIALMNTWSMASLALLNIPVPGDFELVEMGVAIRQPCLEVLSQNLDDPEHNQ